MAFRQQRVQITGPQFELSPFGIKTRTTPNAAGFGGRLPKSNSSENRGRCGSFAIKVATLVSMPSFYRRLSLNPEDFSQTLSRIPALPFCHTTVIDLKTRAYDIPSPTTLGEHILAKRRQEGLFQKDVARYIGVNQDTILDWENNQGEPEVQYWPRIMEFLGYCPYRQAKTWGDLLLLHRTHRGLSHRQLAKIVGCDPGSISRWETGERKPGRKARERLESFFGTEIDPRLS